MTLSFGCRLLVALKWSKSEDLYKVYCNDLDQLLGHEEYVLLDSFVKRLCCELHSLESKCRSLCAQGVLVASMEAHRGKLKDKPIENNMKWPMTEWGNPFDRTVTQ